MRTTTRASRASRSAGSRARAASRRASAPSGSALALEEGLGALEELGRFVPGRGGGARPGGAGGGARPGGAIGGEPRVAGEAGDAREAGVAREAGEQRDEGDGRRAAAAEGPAPADAGRADQAAVAVALEVAGEGGRARVAGGRVAGEGARDDRVEGGRDLGPRGGGRGRVLVEVVEDLKEGLPGDRGPAGEEGVEGGAEAVDVGGRADGGEVAERLLGGAVAGGPEEPARDAEGGAGGGGVEVAGEAEVGQADVAVGVDEDVGGLEVAVEDPAGVAVLDGVGEPGDDAGGLGRGEGALAGDALLEGLARDVLGDEVGGALVLADVEEVDDVAVGDPAEGRRLAEEAPAVARVGVAAGEEELEGDDAARPRGAGRVHDAHAAAGDLAEEGVGADPLHGDRVAGGGARTGSDGREAHGGREAGGGAGPRGPVGGGRYVRALFVTGDRGAHGAGEAARLAVQVGVRRGAGGAVRAGAVAGRVAAALGAGARAAAPAGAGGGRRGGPAADALGRPPRGGAAEAAGAVRDATTVAREAARPRNGPMTTPNPHDRFADAVFRDPAEAAVVFRAVLPSALVRELDFARAELQPRLFTSDELRQRRSDFLFRVPLRAGGEVFLLALLEHQSTVDPLMAARLLVYAGRALDRFLREHPGAREVPALIPVVLFHGEGGWTAATELFELYALPEDLRPVVRGYVPALRYAVDDLDAASDDALLQRAGPTLARLALILMRHAHELRVARDPAAVARSLPDVVGDLLRRVLDRTGRTVALRYILEVVDTPADEVERVLVQAMPEPVKEDVVTAADQLRAEGSRQLLLVQLRSLGPLPPELEERVRAAPPEEIERWALRVPKAKRLDDVFGERASE